MQKKQKIKAVEEIGNLLCMNAKFGRVISPSFRASRSHYPFILIRTPFLQMPILPINEKGNSLQTGITSGERVLNI